jgi:hypothetical protein
VFLKWYPLAKVGSAPACYGSSLGSNPDISQKYKMGDTLQRKNAENLKQIFPGKEYRGLSPNFHIHVSVSELYIPTIELPFLLEEICGPIMGIYKSLTDTYECGNWG